MRRFHTNEVIGGRFRVEERIGNGSFGTVNRCVDLCNLQEGAAAVRYAVKSVPPDSVEAEAKRLAREVDVMSFLQSKHPHNANALYVFVTAEDEAPGSRDPVQGWSRGNPTSSDSGASGSSEGPICGLQPLDVFLKWKTNAETLKQFNSPESITEQWGKGRGGRGRHRFWLHLVMPLMKGDLKGFINDEILGRNRLINPHLLALTCTVIAFQLAYGLDYLHKSGIVHRDIKPENLLLQLNTCNAFETSAIIADYGLARHVSLKMEGTPYVCTRCYRPPELIVSEPFSGPSVDIWSLGCTLFEMITGEILCRVDSARGRDGGWDGKRASEQLEIVMNQVGNPPIADIEAHFQGSSEGARSYLIKSHQRPSRIAERIRANWMFHEEGSDACCPSPSTIELQNLWIDLISQCVRFFPAQRPTAEELCCHELFKRENMHYGDNVPQCEIALYTPPFSDDNIYEPDGSKREFQLMILDIVIRGCNAEIQYEREQLSLVSGAQCHYTGDSSDVNEEGVKCPSSVGMTSNSNNNNITMKGSAEEGRGIGEGTPQSFSNYREDYCYLGMNGGGMLNGMRTPNSSMNFSSPSLDPQLQVNHQVHFHTNYFTSRFGVTDADLASSAKVQQLMEAVKEELRELQSSSCSGGIYHNNGVGGVRKEEDLMLFYSFLYQLMPWKNRGDTDTEEHNNNNNKNNNNNNNNKHNN